MSGIEVEMHTISGEFAEDKDVARDVREQTIRPALEDGNEVIIDFEGVELATQSFIHALLSEVIRSQGPDVLDLLVFRNCNSTIQGLVELVVEYSQFDVEDLREYVSENDGET